MDHAEFSWLSQHAHMIPMLAMQQVIHEINGDLETASPSPELFSSSIGTTHPVDWIDDEPGRGASSVFNAADTPLAAEDWVSAEPLDLEDEKSLQGAIANFDAAFAGPFDASAFLAHAYANPPPDRDIAVAFAHADLVALSQALAQQPQSLPALTQPLTGEGLTQWLAFFRTEDPGCEDLMFTVAKLYP